MNITCPVEGCKTISASPSKDAAKLQLFPEQINYESCETNNKLSHEIYGFHHAIGIGSDVG